MDKTSGILYLVGIGPGDASLRTPAAADALVRCDVLIGYTGYIERIGALLGGASRAAEEAYPQRVIAMPLGAEMERAAKAVALASDGLTVALVSSGDAGVYGMAGPALEYLASIGWDGTDPELCVLPGVTAAQAAAAALGAPLMQDFCAISLSDLLTPWDAIRKRLEAAAQADFVIALYNPRSRKRRKHIVEAHAIVSRHRSPNTPVGIVRNASRSDETSLLTTVSDMPAHFHRIDMFTTLIIGNSTSYAHAGRIITPRGYTTRKGDG